MRLFLLNVVACLVFAVSATIFFTSGESSPSILIALFSLILSIAFLLAFAGVSVGRRENIDGDAFRGTSGNVYDVIVVGGGIAGASLAITLGRQGKRVALIESTPEPKETIKGELLQPGGVRALERLGLMSVAKDPSLGSIRVDGYVCILPKTKEGKKEESLILTYPDFDPMSTLEHLGLGLTHCPEVVSFDEIVKKDASGEKVPETVGSGLSDVSSMSGIDTNPKGRSFLHNEMLRRLRKIASDEPNVTVHWGFASELLTCRNLAKLYREAESQDHCDGEVVLPPRNDISPVYLSSIAPERVLGTRVRPIDGSKDLVLVAGLTVLADGMFSAFRTKVSPDRPVKVSHALGYILPHDKYRPPLPYPNRGHVVLADPTPILFYQISPTVTRTIIDIPQSLYSSSNGNMKAHLLNILAPQLPESLRKPFIDAVSSQEPNSMPCMSLSAEIYTIDSKMQHLSGTTVIGDVRNMRHPLTGGGMTVALRDVELLSSLLRSLPLSQLIRCTNSSQGPLGAEEAEILRLRDQMLARRISTFASERVTHAACINILATALYKIFSTPVTEGGKGTLDVRNTLREGCVKYMQMGRFFSAGPVNLLSGLTPQPWVLALHFFAVAIFSALRALGPLPTPWKVYHAWMCIRVACAIIMPLIINEKAPFLSNWLFVLFTKVCFPWGSIETD